MVELPLEGPLIPLVWHLDLRMALYLRRRLLLDKAWYLIGHILSLNIFISVEDHFKFQISLGCNHLRLLWYSGERLLREHGHSRWQVWHLILNKVYRWIFISLLRTRLWFQMFQIVYAIASAAEDGLKWLLKLDLEMLGKEEHNEEEYQDQCSGHYWYDYCHYVDCERWWGVRLPVLQVVVVFDIQIHLILGVVHSISPAHRGRADPSAGASWSRGTATRWCSATPSSGYWINYT